MERVRGTLRTGSGGRVAGRGWILLLAAARGCRRCAGISPLLIEVESANSNQEYWLRLAHVAQESGGDDSGYRHAHAGHWRYHSHLHGGVRGITSAAALPLARSAGDGLVEGQRAQ